MKCGMLKWTLLTLGITCLFLYLGMAPVHAQQKTIILATTTSTQDSDLQIAIGTPPSLKLALKL